jgi:hypothetical protein
VLSQSRGCSYMFLKQDATAQKRASNASAYTLLLEDDVCVGTIDGIIIISR